MDYWYINVNIYDFDNTIYDGDSSVDFFKYCIGEDKRCLFILPKFALMSFLYFIKIANKEQLKSCFFSFIKYFSDIDKMALNFWKHKKYKLKEFYIKCMNKNDIIVSASPYFLLECVAQKYGIKLIATEMNKKTGKIKGKNCHGNEKVRRLKKENIYECEEFYSDSLSDEPLSKIAKKAYIVKKEKIIPWDEYKKQFK